MPTYIPDDLYVETEHGYAELFHNGQIWSVRVTEEFRGQGHGRHLMETVLDKAVEVGHQQVSLYVYAWNTVARRLYESLGFVDMTPEHDRRQGLSSTLYMVLDLRNRTTNKASNLLATV